MSFHFSGACCAVALLLVSPTFAQQADRFQAHLAAGEFGLARAIAAGIQDPGERDRHLADIAAAQSRQGARSGSLETAYDIAGTRTRTDALRGMQQMPLGGGVQPDFDSLIQLITSTIAPPSWSEVGGPGSVEEFQGGVRVDSEGLLKKAELKSSAALADVRKSAAKASANRDPRRSSPLRRVSLTRLEKELQIAAAAGMPLDDVARNFAGLQRVKYVFVFPETNEIVVAGPAGDWRLNEEGRAVAVENNRPVVQLDDFVVTFRNAFDGGGRFGCSITPTKDGLAAAKSTIEKWAAKPLKPGQRDKWLDDIRSSLGKQDIEVYGIDPRTRAALVLVEADYRMKQVGLGLEPSVAGVTTYFEALDPAQPAKMDVLRWWFTLNHKQIKTTPVEDAFELRGPGVKILSENELLTKEGERVHTGQANDATKRFADTFTEHFERIAAKYPIYAELRNVLDLAVVSALLKQHDLPERVGWQPGYFAAEGGYVSPLGEAPQQVDSIVAHKELPGKKIVAGISGGVRCDPAAIVAPDAIEKDSYGLLKAERGGGPPRDLPRHAWWWD